MKNKISALMDGELDSADVADTISQVKRTEELRNGWSTYHLIGDALRHSELSTLDISSEVRKKLAVEQIVLTRELPKEHKGKVFAFAIAASMVTAVAAVVWMGGQTMDKSLLNPITDKTVHQTASNTKPAIDTAVMPALAQEEEFNNDKPIVQATDQTESAVIPLSESIQLNYYLFAHEEFSPRSAISGVSPYMRTVADPYKRPANR